MPSGSWIKLWQDAGYPCIRVAVNITSQQLNQFNIVGSIQSILQETNVSPEYLELELTENSIINNPNIIKSLNELKQLGVFIALDDFGSGYSTIHYLRSLALDRLKIDKSFIQNISINSGDEAIIQAIIDMAKGFKLDVLAEGVENQAQLQFLKNKQCHQIQGFYYSKPLPVIEVEKYLNHEININKILENKNNNNES